MISNFIETIPGVASFISENDVDSKQVTLLEYFLELFMVKSCAFGDQTME